MSNRDKFLLVIIGIAGVILLPYFLYIKDARDRIMNLDNEIVQLEARYQELLEYEKNREMYEEGIVEYTRLRDEIVAKYPADIQQASTLMYLLNMEYSEAYTASSHDIEGHADDEFEIVTIEPGIRVHEGTFTGNIVTPISSQYLMSEEEKMAVATGAAQSSEIVETNYAALQNTSSLSFKCYDPTMVNHLLGYIRDDEEYPMIYTEINFKMDETTGRVEGDMKLAQYAVRGGEDREFVPIPVKPEIDEDHRGNEVYGVFGPWETRLAAEYKAAQEEEQDGNTTSDEDGEDEDEEED